jgi:hypothetical protein
VLSRDEEVERCEMKPVKSHDRHRTGPAGNLKLSKLLISSTYKPKLSKQALKVSPMRPVG